MSLTEQDFQADALAGLDRIIDYVRFAYSCFNQTELFYGHGTDNAWDEAVHLVLGSLHLPWDTDKALLDANLTIAEKQSLAEAIRKRVIERIPVPYILGKCWFMGLLFSINQNVLVPRSPIAELLDHRLAPYFDETSPDRILDLCCGSGCIGIAAAYVFDEAKVLLTDLSEQALEVTNENIAHHDLTERVTSLKSDLFVNIEGQFDLILTNPPYVDARDMASLPDEYKHEPRLGLESGVNGLNATKVILAEAAQYLKPDGILICEVGNSLPALMEQFPEVIFVCPEFEHGGDGVFILTYDQLIEHQELFRLAADQVE